MSNTQKGVIAAVVVILVIVIAVVFLRGNDGPAQVVGTPATGMAVEMGSTDKIPAADHEAYVASAIPACKASGMKAQKVVDGQVPESAIDGYCRCFAEKSADVLTLGEMNAIAASPTKSMPDTFAAKVQVITQACAAEYLPPAK